MSLRFFHIVFIVLALLLSVLTGLWSLGQYRALGAGSWLALGIGCLAVAAGLLVYGVWFLRKTRGEEYR